MALASHREHWKIRKDRFGSRASAKDLIQSNTKSKGRKLPLEREYCCDIRRLYGLPHDVWPGPFTSTGRRLD